LTNCIVFGSGIFNTGTTSLSVNVASLLAQKGYLVTLIDMDFHNPSVYKYFRRENVEKKVTLNDYLLGSENPDLIVDLTPIVERYSLEVKTGGGLFCIFADAQNEHITEIKHLEQGKSTSIRRLKRLVDYDIFDREFTVNKNREHLGNPDFVILDINIDSKFWLSNGLALTDTVFAVEPFLAIGNGTKFFYWQILNVFQSYGKKIQLIPPIPFYKNLYRSEFLTALRYPEHIYSGYVKSVSSLVLVSS
jgi:hypothetical protein